MQNQKNYIKNNDVVSIAFILTDEQGTVLDLASKDAPMRYMHGHNNILKGLEKALHNKTIGEQLQITLPPEDAYGVKDTDPQPVPKNLFPENTIFQVGAGMMAKSEDGKPFPLWIAKIDDDCIYVDASHPLAGKTLHFDLQIINIRPATQDELKDGRPHDGCDQCKP